MKYEEMAQVVEITRRGEYVLFVVRAPRIAHEAQPGQFVNIRVSDSLDPLLRRPLSIADRDGDTLRFLFQIRGKGTALLANKKRGDELSLVGPLGKSFPKVKGELIFIGGGVGVAPFVWLRRVYPEAFLIVGARSRSLLPPLEWFGENNLCMATDDGSVGIKGTVIDALQGMDLSTKSVFACGPHRMLSALAYFFSQHAPDIEAYFSTESRMACGFGACKGCILPRRDDEHYALCCSDGPVFHWKEIAWEK